MHTLSHGVFGGLAHSMGLNGIIAFSSGILSFFAPCVLPLVPSYLIFISGVSIDHLDEPKTAKFKSVMLTHSIAFVFGFSLVFVVLGISSSMIGEFLSAYQTYISRIGGLLLIIMGLFTLNLIKIPFLSQEKIIHLKNKTFGLSRFLHRRYRLFPRMDTLYWSCIVFHIDYCFHRRKYLARRISVKHVFPGICRSIYPVGTSFRSTIGVYQRIRLHCQIYHEDYGHTPHHRRVITGHFKPSSIKCMDGIYLLSRSSRNMRRRLSV